MCYKLKHDESEHHIWIFCCGDSKAENKTIFYMKQTIFTQSNVVEMAISSSHTLYFLNHSSLWCDGANRWVDLLVEFLVILFALKSPEMDRINNTINENQLNLSRQPSLDYSRLLLPHTY